MSTKGRGMLGDMPWRTWLTCYSSGCSIRGSSAAWWVLCTGHPTERVVFKQPYQEKGKRLQAAFGSWLRPYVAATPLVLFILLLVYIAFLLSSCSK